jgi:hypothetical protein
MRGGWSNLTDAGATILPREEGYPMELTEAQRQRRAEYRREVDELFKRKDKFKNGAEALQAFHDLFDSLEEMEEFGRYLQQEREKERARYRD